MWRRCAPSALCRGLLLPRAAAAPACRVIAQPRPTLHANRALATRGLSLLAGESPPPSTTRASETANLENTYIMRIEPELLEGQPEMVRRMFMLLNGRRSDLTKAQKHAALKRHRQFVDDTGSPEVQAAVLSRGIHAMSAHLSANKKDNNCKRILTRLIHRRRKVLQHLYRLSPKRYFQALEDLGLRQTVAPPPQPTYNTKFDVYRIKPGMGTKRQKKKAQKFEDKLQKWKDLKAVRRQNRSLEAPST